MIVAGAGGFCAGGGHQQCLADEAGGNFAGGDVDQRALPRGAAPVQRGDDGHCRVHADGVVHDVAHLDRRAVGEAGEVRQAAPGAEQRGIAGEVRIRAGLAAGADRQHDQVGLDRLQRLVAQPEAADDPGAEAFRRNVGDGDDALGQRDACRLLEVDADRLLGGGDLVERGRAGAAIDRVRLAEGIGAHGALDLDDFGAELAEQVGAERAGVVHGEVGNADAGQRIAGLRFHAADSRLSSPRAGGPLRSASGAPSICSGETSMGSVPTPSIWMGWNRPLTASCGSRRTSPAR